MTVTRANVEATKAFIRARVGNPYVYGGALSPTNVRQGTDCSEVCQTSLEMALGRYRAGRQSEGATTESYRYIPIGGVGPFGTIRVANPNDVPADAAAKVALHHGPGGGANSHMWMELDGMRIESAGSKGLVTGGNARAFTDSYGTAWCYLPGPVDGADAPSAPIGIGSTGPDVEDLQRRLNSEGAGLEVDGDYGQLTANALNAYNTRVPYAQAVLAEGQRRGITPRGIQIAYSVAFVESGWKMYANSNVPESLSIPHDAVGSDHDSLGLFQQRCPMWGPAAVLMNPAASAGLFYDRLVKLDYNGPRLPGDYAADVQRPAAQYRGRYQERMGHAVALYTRITTVIPTDPIEELLMSDTAVPSWSIYATPGEPAVPLVNMLRAIDAKEHRDAVEDDARHGDLDAIRRIARTAAGKGTVTTAYAISRAASVLNEINAARPDLILAATPGKA